tara:strand:- start:20 stop:217 length:198 start_codon:yes stop_codon:yes gene_type:complete
MEENKTIKLSPLSVLGYRVMHRYRNRDYEEYRALVNVAMDILNEIPKPIQEKLVKSKFLLNEDIS